MNPLHADCDTAHNATIHTGNKMKIFNTSILAICTMLISIQTVHAATDVYTAAIRGDQIVKTDDFSCSDDVYVYVINSENSASETLVEYTWKDPAGIAVREESRALESVANNGSYGWDGIIFNPGGDNFMSAFTSFLDPSAGLEDVIGTWEVSLMIPHQGERKINFYVSC